MDTFLKGLGIGLVMGWLAMPTSFGTESEWIALCHSEDPDVQHTVNVMVEKYGKGQSCEDAYELLSETKILDFENTEIHTIVPVVIFEQIEELWLFRQHILELPDQITRLQQLKKLVVSSPNFRRIPGSLGTLANLETLYIYGCNVSEIPSEIGNLQKLKHLSLWGNQLSKLPPSIGNLSSLEELYLGDNPISELPPEIGKLSKLRILFVWDNKLQTLPKEIGGLTKLEYLSLSGNAKMEFPPEMGKLTNLRGLFLRDTGLHNIPSAFGGLARLKELDLRDNPAKQWDIPESMTGLSWMHISEGVHVALPPVLQDKVKVVIEDKRNDAHAHSEGYH